MKPRNRHERRALAAIERHGGEPLPDDDELLATKPASTFVGFDPKGRWLETLSLRGSGPRYIKLGRHCVRYRKNELRRWLAERERTSTSDPGPRTAA